MFLSSMEAFGEVREEKLLDENALGTVDLSRVRSCYPESKRMCEMICTSYAKEYGVPAMSIRLAQTFGPGVDYDDRRVFAMMTRNAINGEDIVLATKGNKPSSVSIHRAGGDSDPHGTLMRRAGRDI